MIRPKLAQTASLLSLPLSHDQVARSQKFWLWDYYYGPELAGYTYIQLALSNKLPPSCPYHFYMDQVAPPENSDRGAGIMEYGPQ
jgi:hypothetical protein